jgi:hypothetical protein
MTDDIEPTSSPTNDFETREEAGLGPSDYDNHLAYGFVVVLTGLAVVIAGVVLMVVVGKI